MLSKMVNFAIHILFGIFFSVTGLKKKKNLNSVHKFCGTSCISMQPKVIILSPKL